MKAKLNFRSKRTIIIAAIIGTLAVAAGVGGYFYAKGNNQAGATNVAQSEQREQTATEQQAVNPAPENNGETPAGTDANNGNGATDGTVANNDNADATTPDGATANNDGGNAGNAPAGNNGNAANGGAGNAANAGNAGNGGAANAADDTDATTVTETVTETVTVEEPWESHSVAWMPETLNTSIPEVDVNRRNLDVKKTSTTSTGYRTSH